MAPTPAQVVAKNSTLRQIIIAQLSEIFEISSVVESDPTQVNAFMVRYDTLASLYTQFKEYHWLIVPNFTEADDIAAQETIRKEVDNMYFSIQATHRSITASYLPSIEQTPRFSDKKGNVKLPRIAIPSFDGTQLNKWPTFLDLFNSLIHENDSLSPIEKFQYLVSSLSKEPLNVVTAVPMTNINYPAAYGALVKRFQNKRRLATSYWDMLYNFPPLTSDSQKSLRKLCNTFSENLSALRALQFPIDAWDFPLFNILWSKLDPITKEQFELAFSQVELPTFKELEDFIAERAKAFENLQGSDQNGPSKEVKPCKSKPKPQAASTFVANVSSTKLVCDFCQAEHLTYRCSQFVSKTPRDRYQLAKDTKLCLNCLRLGHSVSRCSSSSSCRTCGQRHHTLLHFRSSSDRPTSPKQTSSQLVPRNSNQNSVVENPNALTATVPTTTTVLLSTAVVEILDRWGNYQRIRILLDGGSQANFISQKCLQRLGFKATSCSVAIQGLSSSNIVSAQGLINCTIKPLDQLNPELNIQALVIPQICNQMPSVPINTQEWSHILNLRLADPSFNQPSPIDMLLGAEFFPTILLPGQRSTSPNKPVALNTIFGWVLMGKVSFQQPSSVTSLHVTLEPSLSQTLQQFWELEQVPSQRFVSPQDELVEKTFSAQHYRDSSGRFVVPLLLKSECLTFVDSYSIALRRFLALERRFIQDPLLRDSYIGFMQDYLASNHMQLLDSSQDLNRPDSYYIPHHAVYKADHQSNKIRVVFDASSKDSDGHSLNDSLFVGPKLQNDLVGILLRFRFHSVVFTADIRQMYRQILIRPQERKYQRIVWRSVPTDPIQVYQLSTVTYGVSSSPFNAIRSLLQLAEDEKSHFPLASQAINSDIYIDDLVTGCRSLHEAKALQKQIVIVMSHAQLELRKWTSNHPSLLEDIPPEHRQVQSLSFADASESTVKILGLQWHPSSDDFSYEVGPHDRPCTKRNLLSELARIFDPLGFLSPLTFHAKHLIQRLWTCGLDWDDTPNSDISSCWNRFKTELPYLSYLQIPRRLVTENWESCQLHGFCDASSIGYAAVVYFRVVNTDGQIDTYLVCAKSKVAPLKTVSIPRLELCAAVLLSNLVSFVVATFEHLVTFDQIFAWSDSSVALSWIRSSPHRWKPFVSNRVAHIQEKLPSSTWNHIRSFENPADCASRGLFPIDLLNHHLWWSGPTWLQGPPNTWPSKDSPFLDNLSDSPLVIDEERKVVLTITIPSNFILSLLDKYSSLPKIQRIVAYCLRFIHNLRHPNSKVTTPLTSVALQQSLNVIAKSVQRTIFAEDIRQLENSLPCSKPVRKLNPFIDPLGVLRVGGRIRHSDLGFDAKHPMLLPRTHRLTQLVIEDIHQRFLHPGLKTVHFLLSQNFWILSARRAIRSCLSKCYRCFRLNPSSTTPLMGDLPSIRVSRLKPFSHVGVDYAGPFRITMGKHRGAKTTKAYLCLFVCMATKALHLELVSDLTSEACLSALRRLIARRGRCSHLYSDCGTNFVGANRELVSLLEHSAAHEQLAWSFNPPHSPHFGGLWEAGVKSVKTHLYRIIGDQILTYEELQTVFIQIEALLNSRPLCELSPDPNDLSSLTPGHFLTLEPLSVLPDPDLSHLTLNRLSRWQLLQRLHHDFWKRWHSEYLHTLQQRHKWNKNVPSLTPDTLVVIKDDSTPPMHWRLGRITELIAGKDGINRVAVVRTKQGLVKRPIVKLCPLPTQ